MGTGVKDQYHVAINGKGYMLRGAPDKAAYSRSVIPSQVERMAISDLAYSDFAGQGLFYLAQTDWYAGVKSEITWRDDAKFYYSTNIDAYSQPGALKQELALSLNEEFDELIITGISGSVDGNVTEYVGCENDTSGNVKIYRWWSSAWGDIATTTFATSQNVCAQLLCHKNKLWAFTVGTGNTWVVASWDWSSWTDHSAAIIAACSYSAMSSCRAACEYGDVLYLLGEQGLNNKLFLMSSADNGATWTEEVYFSNIDVMGVAICGFNGKIYYLLNDHPITYLRCFDPATSTDILVEEFRGTSAGAGWGQHNLLVVFKNKLVITIPHKRIFELDTAGNLEEVWTRDTTKYDIGAVAEGYIYYGPLEFENRLLWANLIYDGEAWYNHKRPSGDSASNRVYPSHIEESGYIRYFDGADKSKLYNNASTYKTTLANNYAVSNEMSPVGAIEKLLDSVTILFEKMVSGNSIQVYYSIDEMATWVDLGTRSYSATDDSTKKEFKIPGTVLFNKIYFKVHLDGGSTSAVLTDLIMAYRPMPDYKNRWDMRLNFSEAVKLLNKQTDQREGYELNSELWNEKITKQKVVFEDVDYVECDIVSAFNSAHTSAWVDSTKRFPRQGRIRAVSGEVSEEMFYTSALTNKLLGISRGQRGTVARTYSAGQQLDNAYDVYIDDIRTEVNFTDEKKTESVAQVKLIES